MTLEANVRAGKMADDAAKFLRELAETVDVERFYRRLATNLYDQLKPSFPDREPEVKPMDDAEAKRFETEIMRFGKYAGSTIAQLPIEYLAWLSDEQRTFARKLDAYLRSERIKREQRDYDDPSHPEREETT